MGDFRAGGQAADEQKLELDVGVVNAEASSKPISEDDPEWKAHQLATAMWKIRQEILSIDHQPPCVSFKDGDKDRLMPMTIGFTVVNSGSGGAKITIFPAPLPVVLGGSGAYEGSSGQTTTSLSRRGAKFGHFQTLAACSFWAASCACDLRRGRKQQSPYTAHSYAYLALPL